MGGRKRSKKGGRSRRRASGLPAAAAEAALSRLQGGRAGGGNAVPSSLVIRRGRLTAAARQLVRDVRRVMLPHCGERLRERRSSKLKDYVAAASVLGVTHLQLFTQTDAGLYFKLVQLPAGPTLSFRVLCFTLIHDVQRYQQQRKRNARAPDARDFLHPPLLILSPHTAAAKRRQHAGAAAADAEAQSLHGGGQAAAAGAAREGQEEADVDVLVARVVKSAFPPIDIRTAALRDCRRVVLFRRDAAPSSTSATSSHTQKSSFKYQLRQYAVVRRVAQDGVQVTPGVRALVEAGGSRVAADRLLQQRFGISLQSENGGLPGKGRMIGNCTDSFLSDGCSAVGAATANGKGMPRGPAPKTERATAACEAAGERGEVSPRQKKRSRQLAEQRDDEQEGAASLRPPHATSLCQERPVNGREKKRKGSAWRDICEATLAREHAAAQETDDEEGLLLDVAEVGASDGRSVAPGVSAARRGRDSLLLLSVAAAAQQREKKEHSRTLANETEREDELAAAADESAAQEVAGAAVSMEGEDVHKQESEKLKMNISLVELGPRMHLELVKVEEDVCAGAVFFHNFVKKSAKEVLELQKRDATLRRQREKERVAVETALKRNFQRRKRWKDAADRGCHESIEDLPSSEDEGAFFAAGRNLRLTGDPLEGPAALQKG